jgi:hypothetical protein
MSALVVTSGRMGLPLVKGVGIVNSNVAAAFLFKRAIWNTNITRGRNYWSVRAAM